MDKIILDAACGSRMFWFDKNNPHVEFCDKRTVPYHEYYPGRCIEIKPDTVCDFTSLPFENDTFYLVVFDPPHLTWAGPKSWTRLKYGCLDNNWQKMIHDGFAECMRVLKPNGTLIFKWSEVQIPLSKILKAIGIQPLFGHRSGKNMNTHWLAFMKIEEGNK
jgi:SAM-dependent methyltransferase